MLANNNLLASKAEQTSFVSSTRLNGKFYQESSNLALSYASGRVSSHIIYSTAIARLIHMKASSTNPFIRLPLQTVLATRNLSTQTSHLSTDPWNSYTPAPIQRPYRKSDHIGHFPQPIRTIDGPYARSLHGSCLRKPVHGGVVIFKDELERLHCPVRPIQGMDVVSLVQWGFIAHIRGLVELGDKCCKFQPSLSLLVSQFECARIWNWLLASVDARSVNKLTLITTAKLLPYFQFCIPTRWQVCPENIPLCSKWLAWRGIPCRPLLESVEKLNQLPVLCWLQVLNEIHQAQGGVIVNIARCEIFLFIGSRVCGQYQIDNLLEGVIDCCIRIVDKVLDDFVLLRVHNFFERIMILHVAPVSL